MLGGVVKPAGDAADGLVVEVEPVLALARARSMLGSCQTDDNIGSSVKLTNIEISTAADDGDAELVEELADDAAHESRSARTPRRSKTWWPAPPDRSPACRPARPGTALAHLHVAHDVLAHHDRIVDQQAHAQAQRHQVIMLMRRTRASCMNHEGADHRRSAA